MTRSSIYHSQRPADPAVLADAPEVDGDQHRHDHRDEDAVQHVEAQQRVLADERAGQQEEPRVASRRGSSARPCRGTP